MTKSKYSVQGLSNGCDIFQAKMCKQQYETPDTINHFSATASLRCRKRQDPPKLPFLANIPWNEKSIFIFFYKACQGQLIIQALIKY